MRNIFILLALLALPGRAWAWFPGDDIDIPGTLTVGAYVRHVQVPAFTAGTPAQQATAAAYDTAGCLEFSTSADKYSYFQWEIPEDWTGGDITVEIDWFPVVTLPEGDTVTWDVNYVSVAEGEVIAGRTITNLTDTITGEVGDTAQYKTIHTGFTFAYNNADNPLVHEDHIYVQVIRDVSEDDFANSACVSAYEIIYTSNTLPEGN